MSNRHERRPVICGKGDKSVTIWIPRRDWLEERRAALKARHPQDPVYRPDLHYSSPENEAYRQWIIEKSQLERDEELANAYADQEEGEAVHPYSNHEHREKVHERNRKRKSQPRELGQQVNRPNPHARKTADEYAQLAWDWVKEMRGEKPLTPGWLQIRARVYQFISQCRNRAQEDGIPCPKLPAVPCAIVNSKRKKGSAQVQAETPETQPQG